MKKNVICIIPARGGSKGIKFKNLAKVCDQPLISYPIRAAIKSKVCDHIFVSTDSEKIRKVAIKCGADVPFLRKKKFSRDRTTTEETLRDALIQCEKYYKKRFDYCVFLTCTNIFRNASDIKKAYSLIKKNNKIDSVFSVHKFYKHIWHNKRGKTTKILAWMKSYTSRQTAPSLYREDTGVFLITKSKFWREGKRIGKIVKFIINNDTFTGIDIHSKEDLVLANAAMRFLKKKKLIDH